MSSRVPARVFLPGSAALAVGAVGVGLVLAVSLPADAGGGNGDGSLLPLPTTDADFFQQGTQPAMEGVAAIVDSTQCAFCHSNYDAENEPYTTWNASVMGQAARDPMFWAGVDVANADAEGAGQFCIRCHAPGAFLGGRLDPPDGSAFTGEDLQGIMCNFCHRVLDQDFKPGISPVEDESILASLGSNAEYWPDGLIPPQGSNARYIVDPVDSRRGPLDDLPFNPHLGNPQAPVIVSPHHRTSELCWTCHDVSNPVVWRDHENDRYVLGDLDASHPTQDQADMFPLHRTYSEWKNSYYFALGGVQHNGRFGGNHPTGVMSVCQDCHLPDQQAFGCNLGDPFPLREDMPQHAFIGSNTWVVGAVRDLFGEAKSGLTQEMVDAARARNIDLLENASDLTLTQRQTQLRARVINQGGHKLPTGFPDGRRIWINVKFYDRDEMLLREHGVYDFDEAVLSAEDTTVFESVLGLDEEQAALTGLDAGATFHFVLANVTLKDNRIPPQGFSNDLAIESQHAPVGETYANGQHWHDTDYPIPDEAVRAVVTVYYQLTSRDFIEFLRDNGGERGQIAFDAWDTAGQSQPVVMDMSELEILNPADLNEDGVVNFEDLLLILTFWGACPEPPADCPVDLNNDGVVDFSDILVLLSNWGAPTGACCLADGTCIVVGESACTAQEGVYQGDRTGCGVTECPAQPSGPASRVTRP